MENRETFRSQNKIAHLKTPKKSLVENFWYPAKPLFLFENCHAPIKKICTAPKSPTISNRDPVDRVVKEPGSNLEVVGSIP